MFCNPDVLHPLCCHDIVMWPTSISSIASLPFTYFLPSWDHTWPNISSGYFFINTVNLDRLLFSSNVILNTANCFFSWIELTLFQWLQSKLLIPWTDIEYLPREDLKKKTHQSNQVWNNMRINTYWQCLSFGCTITLNVIVLLVMFNSTECWNNVYVCVFAAGFRWTVCRYFSFTTALISIGPRGEGQCHGHFTSTADL